MDSTLKIEIEAAQEPEHHGSGAAVYYYYDVKATLNGRVKRWSDRSFTRDGMVMNATTSAIDRMVGYYSKIVTSINDR